MAEHVLQRQAFEWRHGVGFSGVGIRRLHDAMRRHVDASWVPGLVAILSRRGREVVEVIGSQAFGGGAPMRRDTIFRLASVTKPITAAAAMILVEECKLRLDDPVDAWLPELEDRKVVRSIGGPLDDTVPAKRAITLRDLLTLRSGYGELAPFFAREHPIQKRMAELGLPLTVWLFDGTQDELMKRLGTLPLASQPGERWLYHMGLEIAGVLVSRVSGKSLGAFLRERIFEPLGMTDTGFHVPPEKLDRLATCYGSHPESGEVIVADAARGGLVSRPPPFESGAGGLVSTADDLLAFGRMMVNKGSYGRERILSRATVELMMTDQLTPEQKAVAPFFQDFWESWGWGFGGSMVTARHDVASVPGRFGWDGAFGPSWYVDPKEELVGVLMTQRTPVTLSLPPVTRDFWTSTYAALED